MKYFLILFAFFFSVISNATVTFNSAASGPSGNATLLQGRSISTTAPTSGQVLTWNTTSNSWAPQAAGGGGGTPAGSSGQIQFNNSGAFGASSSLFWDNTNGRLGVGTNTPNFVFDVVGSSGNYAGLYSDGTVQVVSASDGSAGWLGTQSNHPLNLVVNDSAKLVLNPDETITTGAFTADGRVHINGPGGTTNSYLYLGNGGDGVGFTLDTPSGNSIYSWPNGYPASSGYLLSSTTAGVMTWVAPPTATPAGSNGQVQFNNSGAFGAESNLFWDAGNNRLGIGTSSPESSLHIVGADAPYTFKVKNTAGGSIFYMESGDSAPNTVSFIVSAQSGGASTIGTQTDDSVGFRTNGTDKLKIEVDGRVKILSQYLKLYNSASDPGSAEAGAMYFNTTSNVVKVYDGTTWKTITFDP